MRTLPILFVVLSMGALGAVAACSGGDDQTDGGSDATADGPVKKDAGNQDVSADVPVTCTAASTYSGVTNQTAVYTPTPVDGGADAAPDAAADAAGDAAPDAAGDATDDADDGSADSASDAVADASDAGASDGGGVIGGTEDVYQYNGTLDVNSDLLDIEVYAGFGAFTGGIHTGTFNLAGADLDYGTCGLCVLVLSNGQNDAYMATGGSVTITSFQGTFAGSLSNVNFEHVTIDPNTFESTSAGDGCKTSIAALSISATVTQQ